MIGLGKLSVPGGPTNLDYSRARAYCLCSKYRTGGGRLNICFSSLSSLSFFLPLSGRWPEIEILSQRAFKPKTTNQHSSIYDCFMMNYQGVYTQCIFAF